MMDLLYIIGLFVIVLALAYVSYRNFVSLDERLRKIENVLQGAQVVVRPPTNMEMGMEMGMGRDDEPESEIEGEAEASVVSGWGGQTQKNIRIQSSGDLDGNDEEDDEQPELNLHMEEEPELTPQDALEIETKDLDNPQTSSSSKIVLPSQDELAQLEAEFNVSSTFNPTTSKPQETTDTTEQDTETVHSASQHKPGTRYIGITAIKTALHNAGISFAKNAKKEDLMKLAEEHHIQF
jgi:hypothetical protein